MHMATKTMGWFGRMALICLTLAAATGCATLSGDKHTEKNLVTAAEKFNTAIRWGDYSQAAQWIASSRQQQFWKQCDQLKKTIRLTDFQIRHVGWDGTDASQIIIHYSYYYTDDPLVRNKTLQQLWRYVPRLKRWEITQTALAELMPN